MMKLLSVAIVAGLFFGSNQLDAKKVNSVGSAVAKRPAPFPFKPPGWPCFYPTHIQCWTDWFDRDDPSGTGDWETLYNLRLQNPGKICPKPVDIEAKTLSGLTAAAAGDVVYKSDTVSGFVCRNQDQPDKKCNDYRVRFSCHPPFCGGGVCWTKWYDRDNPGGMGDYETLIHLRAENPGQICDQPLYIEAVTTDTLTPAISTGEYISVYNPTEGFACVNKQQRDGRCRDYKVRFGCPCMCWTKWYDRDNPGGKGDYETLIHLRAENPGQICDQPLYIEAVTTDTLTPAISTGENILVYNPTEGFACVNKQQKDGRCRDYKVRFGCPCTGLPLPATLLRG